MTEVEYIVEFDEVERIVGEKAKNFMYDCEGYFVYLRLLDYEFDFSTLLYYWGDAVSFMSPNVIDNEDFTIQRVEDLHKEFLECLEIFKQKTGLRLDVQVNIGMSYNYGYLVANLTDVSILSTNYTILLRKKLEELGIMYDKNVATWTGM